MHNPLRLPRETTSAPPKVARTCCAFNILTWKFASRHNAVHFFDISTSKSAPRLRCLIHFDLEMCFAPQRRALFQHLNFQKCSEREVISAFTLANVHPPLLRAYFLTLRSRKSLEKHGESQLYLFPHLHLLSSDSFSSLLFSDSPHLCLSIYCRKFEL